MQTKKRIAVIGAGISGLACAYELQKKGHNVIVYEKEPRVGGRMSSKTKQGLVFDIGANHLCNLYEHMKEYCAELDIAWQGMEFVKYGVYKKGEILSPYDTIGPISRLRLAIQFLRTADNSHWLNFFNLTSSTDFDTQDAYSYMKRRLGREAADYLVDPFTTTYQFHSAREISLGALISVMELLKYRREDWYLHHTPGGMIALSQALAKKMNVQLESSVKNITGGKTVTFTADEKQQTVDAVVLATTADATKHLYTNPTDDQLNMLDSTRYASTISLAFTVDKDALPDTSVVWVPKVESDTISGYTNEMMKGSELIQDGKSLICAWLHEDYAKQIMDKSDEDIFAETRKELLKYCPWFTKEAELEPYDLHRWPAAMPKFYPGFLTKVKAFIEDHQGDNNVFFCGDYLNSPWTEGSLRCGQRVAEAVMRSFEDGQ